MFCFTFVVNYNDHSCYPPGRHLTCSWSFRALSPATSCIPHRRRPTHPWSFQRRHPTRSWSFRALPHTPSVLLGIAPHALGPTGRRPTRPYAVLVGADQHTLGPSGCRPMRAWSSPVRPHAFLVLPGAALYQKTQPLPVRSGGRRKKSTVATEEGRLM